MSYTYDAKVVAWIDGDTVALEVWKDFDMGFKMFITGSYSGHFRLAGIDTPERGQPGFREATEAAKLLAPIDSIVSIETFKPDKYGRWLITVMNSEGQNVNEELLAQGHAKPYLKGVHAVVSGEVAMWMGSADGQTQEMAQWDE